MNESSRYCFVPHETEIFKVAEIVASSGNELTVVDLQDKLKRSTINESLVVPIGSVEEMNNPPSDLIKLIHVHRPGILYTLRTRFFKDLIYTSIGPILVALNPFKWIAGIYGEDVMEKYKANERTLSENPHVFAVAHDAYSDLYMGQNQSLIISGESGAGKTEATKQALNYLAYIAGSATGIQSKILKASPILEGWGNAKTLRNNNSSRFGKYIEIWFDKRNNSIIGSSNTTYILEKSRVVFQEKDERNYHVFYQLLKGASKEVLSRLKLEEMAANPNMVQYINQSGCISIDDVDDAADHHEANAAFNEIGFTQVEQNALYSMIAGILHFGNVNFVANPSNSEESIVEQSTDTWLVRGTEMFGVDYALLKQALLTKKIKSGNSKRTSVAFAAYLPQAALESKNALTKEIYKRCFDWIVNQINVLMGNDTSTASSMIGILDIFGFEIFQKNSFEQLCINLANEALQQHFNFNIFQAEMDTYLAEDVPVPKLEYKDNQDVLDLIIKKPKGLIAMLDEEGIVPRGSFEGFLNKFHKQHTDNPRYKAKGKSKDAVNDLGIVHYAGEVYYDVSLFLIKNKDTLSQDLVEVFQTSTVPFVANLFDDAFGLDFGNGSAKSPDTSPAPKSKRTSTMDASPTATNKLTVGRKFAVQLESLIANLNSTKPRYIRCVKPNQAKKPNIFVSNLTNEQLTYSGVFEAVIIMQNGYPFRLPHSEFRGMFHMLLMKNGKLPFQHDLLYDESAFNQYVKGGNSMSGVDLKKGAKKTKGFRACSREMCIFMVAAVSQAVGEEDLMKCHVGRSRVFYQANQNKILLRLRQETLLRNAIMIQKYTRRFNCHKIMTEIARLEKIGADAIQSRNVDILKNTSAEISKLVDRLNKLNKNFVFSLEIIQIAVDYATALEEELTYTATLKNLLTVDKRDMLAKFDELENTLNLAKDIDFYAVLRGVPLSLQWDDNKDLVAYAETIENFAISVKIRRKLVSNIESGNEVMLEEAIAELKVLKQAKRVEANFCDDEVQTAARLIQNANEHYAEVLEAVKAAIEADLQAHKITSPRASISHNASKTSLAEIVTKYQAEINVDPMKSSGQSERSRQLLKTCNKLYELRALGEANEWQKAWSSLQTDWKEFLLSSQPVATAPRKSSFSTPTPLVIKRKSVNNPTTAANASPPPNIKLRKPSASVISPPSPASPTKSAAVFVPQVVLGLVIEEIRNISLTVINSFIVPKLKAALSRNAVPSTPYYTEFNVKEDEPTVSVVGIDTTELATELTEAEHYSECFDDELMEYMAVVREHLFIRQEVAFGVRDKIIHAIGEVSARKVIDVTSSDYVNLMKYRTLYELEGLLYKYVVEHAVTGQQGAIDFSTVVVAPLSEALGRCAAIQVNGSDWQNLVNICLSVDKIRQLLFKGDYPSAVKWMDSLLNSASWTAVQVKKATPSSLGEGMTSVINSITTEFKLVRVEVAHILAYRLITELLKNTAITGEVDALDYSNKAVETIPHIRQTIDRNKDDLVPSKAIALLLSSAENLLTVRDLFYRSNWTEAEQHILPLFDSDFVCLAHEECIAELTLLFYDVFNRKVKTALVHSITTGFVVRVGDTEWNASEVNTIELKEALDLTDIGYKLSQHCLDMLRAAKIIYLLRVLANDQHWEPENMFFFGHVSTDHLSDHIVGMDKNPLLAKECSAIDRLIQYLQVMDAKLFTRKTQTLVDMIDVQSVTVAQVLSVVKNSTFPPDIQALIEVEINAFLGLTVERNCRLLLLLAASTGKVKGTIESLQTDTTNTNNLKNVIQFVEQTMTTASLSDVVRGWVSGAKQLQVAREAVVKSNTPESLQSSSLAYNVLVEILSESDIKNAIESTPKGFPLEELTLILNKLLDLTATQEIYQAMAHGAPTFTDGKFNVSRVEFAPVHERLTAAKKLTKISDRLDKLFFFAGLCVNVRKAVTAQQWELTMTGEKSAVPMDRNVITVKTCLQEWAQAQRLFSVEGVPPECLKTEFLLVSREWDRRLTLQQFANAFKQGPVEGVPSALVLNNIRTSQVQIEITRAKAIEEETKEIDNDIQLFMKAAQELIDLRTAADAIQKSYKRSFEFRKASSDVRYILKETNFLDDCINTALNTVEGVYKPPFLIMQEWLPMESIIAKLDASPRLANTKKEVNLLCAESLERVFVTDTLTLLYQLAGCINAPVELAVLLNKLLMSINAYYARKERYTHDHTIKSERTSATLEFVLDSAVVLVHFIRARANNLYDEKYHRHWKEDVNFTNTPRLMSLVQHLSDGSYSMQQILRAYVKFDIHFTVRKYLSLAVDEVENEVSRVEMMDALTNPIYVSVGLVGNVRVSADSIEQLQSVLTRIEEMKLELPVASRELHKAAVLMLRLRTAVKHQNHSEAIGIVDEWIGDGTRNMHMLFATFYADKYEMLPVVRAEFITLAKTSFDGYWQILALDALVDGHVCGSRAALQTHAISWLAIDTILGFSRVCTEANMTDYSAALSALCTQVRTLRCAVIDNHTVSFNTDVFNWVSLNQPITVPATMNSISQWVTAIVMQGTATVNLTATVNVNWSEVPYDVNFQETIEQISVITDEISKQLNNTSVHFPANIKEALTEECSLILRHNRFLDLGNSLEDYLRNTPLLTLSEHGVSLTKDIVEPFKDILLACRRGHWDFQLPQEFWWATLAKVSESLLTVLQKIYSFSSELNDHGECVCVIPGSPNFAALLPLIQNLLFIVTDAKNQFSRTGFKKKHQLPKNVVSAIEILSKASKEHYVLYNVDRLVIADEVFTDVNDDGLMSINVRRIHHVSIHDDAYASIPLKQKPLVSNKTDEYLEYAQERIEMLKTLDITSSDAGRTVCLLAQRCIEFRVAVVKRRWHEAKQIATSIEYSPLFPSRTKDVAVFAEYVRILSSRRNLEYAILHCNFPTESGWSINKNFTVAREMVNSIRTSVLTEKVETESKTQHLADKSVVELLKVGKKLIELAQVMKIGQWVSRSDLRKSNHADNRIQIALHLKDAVATFQDFLPEIDLFDEELSSASVYSVVTQLQAILKASKCLDSHLVTFLNDSVLATTELELTIVQLEQLSTKTYRECKISGYPGQLVMDPQSMHKWEYLINSLETAPNVLSNWQTVRQSYESALLLNLILHANSSGDLKNLCKFTDLLLFLNSRKPPTPIHHEPTHFAEKTVDELLEMDESSYFALFDTSSRQRSSSADLCRISFGRKSIYKVDDVQIPYVYPEHANNTDLVKTTYEHVFECTWTECSPIRSEVKEYLELLRHHCIFECQYLKFATLVSERSVNSIVFTTSAFGPPGELVTSAINFSLLRRIMAGLKEQVKLTDDEVEVVKLDRCGHWLYNACHCLQLIREGQLKVDELSILTGVHHAFTSIRQEREVKLPDNCVLFGGVAKSFLVSAEDEIVLADLDMKQRQIIVGMSKALASSGVPAGLFPFDLSVIQISPLTDILEHCNLRCEPTCARAIQLYKSCLIMSTVRELTLSHTWLGLKEFMDSTVNDILDGQKLNEVLDKAQIDEFERAYKVMSISYAVEMAIDSYTTGNARGQPGKLLFDDGNKTNAAPVQKALELLKNLQRPWINDILQEHINACSALLMARRHLISCEWQSAYDKLKALLTSENLSVNPIFGEGLAELQLIFEHASYVIVRTAMLDAVCSGMLEGEVGCTDSTHTTLSGLIDAYEVSYTIDYSHPDIAQLQASVEVLFRLRKSILCNSWINVDHTQSYLKLLGSNFVYPHQDCQDLFANLPLHITVPGHPETVEDVVADIADVTREALVPEAWLEINFIRDEVMFRKIVSGLIKHIHSPGAEGIPGAVDVSSIETQQLEEAIEFAERYPVINYRKICCFLLRDAKWLLYARKGRLLHDWSNMDRILNYAFDLHKERQPILNLDLPDYKEYNEVPAEDFVTPVVWKELNLLKHDAIFHISCCAFAKEMSKFEDFTTIPTPTLDDNDVYQFDKLYDDLHKKRIAAMQDILEFLTSVPEEILLTEEYKRLLEAQMLALELRQFYYSSPAKSPQAIIDRIAAAKRRDKADNVVCYMSLLICDISKMSNVLDFPINLEIIQNEILKGQKYFECPVGQIILNDINLDVMSSAYAAAVPSLEIMGTEENDNFMKLANAVMILRRTLMNGDLRAVMKVISDHEDALLQEAMASTQVGVAVADEVLRLRTEMENFEATKVIEFSLKNGRNVDIFSIARLVFIHDSIPPEIRALNHSSDADFYREDGTIDTLTLTRNSSYNNVNSNSHRYIGKVLTSINTLQRAITVATKLRARSEVTEYYLSAAKFILELRRNILNGHWDAVRGIVASVGDHDLPAIAMDEVRAVQEGLVYEQTMSELLMDISEGSITGTPYAIDFASIDYEKVSKNLKRCAKTRKFTDKSALLLLELGGIIRSIRKAFLEAKWLPSVAHDFQLSERQMQKQSRFHMDDEDDDEELADMSLEDAIDKFLAFQYKNFDFLKGLFNCETPVGAMAATDPPASPKASSKSGIGASMAALSSEKDEWRQYIWNCLWDVVAEVKLVLEVIKYNKTLSAMISCITVLPLSVSNYFLAKNSASSTATAASDRAQLLAAIQPQYNMQEEELISQTSSIYVKTRPEGKKGRRRSSVMRYDTGEEYQLSELHNSIRIAEEYWNDPDHQAMRLDPTIDHDHNHSEELLLLLNSTRMIYKFRCVLASHRPDDFERLIALTEEIKVQQSNEMLSADYGVDELLCYQTVTEQFAMLRAGLLKALNKDRMIGSLDCIGSATGHDYTELEHWIVESNKFLGNAANLSIGLTQLVDQASFIYRLRNAILQKSWALVSSYLVKCNVLTTEDVHSRRWVLIREELLHIFLANRFHALQASIFQTAREFHLIGSIQSQLIVLKQDYDTIHAQMTELCELVRVGKESLTPLSAFALVIITDAFYQHPLFIAWHALYKLLSVVCVDGPVRWYYKTQINDNPTQLVNRRVDPFMSDFFALSQSNFMDVPANLVDNTPVDLNPPARNRGTPVTPASGTSSTPDYSDSVFSALLTCNWTIFPPNIRGFFEEARNTLIDQYLRTDLSYFCSKGCATLDKAGNILISDLYLQFLTLTLSDVQKARKIAEKYYVKSFAFSSVTSRWIESAELIRTCRAHLVTENSLEALEKTLTDRKIISNAMEGSVDGIRQLNVASMDILLNKDFTLVQDELSVFVKYVVAVECKKAISAAVRTLNDVFSADTEWTYNDVLCVHEVKALYAVVNNPRTNLLTQTPYLTKLLTIANSLKSALSATFMGNTDRLQRNIDAISALCGISERVNDPASVVPREDVVLSGMQADFNALFISLCYICAGASQIDLFVVSTKQHRKRGLAKSTASEIAEKVLKSGNNKVVNTLAKRLLKLNNPSATPVGARSEGPSPRAPVSLNYGNTPRLLNYNQLYKSPTTGAVPELQKFTFEPVTPASDAGFSMTGTAVSGGVTGGTLMPSEDVTNVSVSARKITRRLIAALCELKYFEEEDEDVFNTPKDKRCDNVLRQKARIHKHLSMEVPYYCYERIRDLTMDIDDDYRVMEPLWTLTLFIVLHYLNQAVELMPGGVTNLVASDATLLTMPYELFWFIQSINLSKLVLSDDTSNENVNNSVESERPSFVVICQAVDRVLGESRTTAAAAAVDKPKGSSQADLFGVGDIFDSSSELIKTAIRNLNEAAQQCEKVKYPVGVASKSLSQSNVLMKFLSVGVKQ